MAARRQEKRHPGMKPNDLGIQIKFSCLALISLLFTTLALISLIVLVCISYVFKLTSKEPTLEWARENWSLRERSEMR